MPNETMKPRKRSPRNEREFVESAKAEVLTRVGRPYKRGEPCRLKSFNLPLSLIDQIQEEADRLTDGNASSFAVRIFKAYFEKEGSS